MGRLAEQVIILLLFFIQLSQGCQLLPLRLFGNEEVIEVDQFVNAGRLPLNDWFGSLSFEIFLFIVILLLQLRWFPFFIHYSDLCFRSTGINVFYLVLIMLIL